ncbi:MAG: DUF2804 domain-containing protein [Clostridia bacterium]|nr:DUF2804 domain-containing protein [Clostridia bacterium]
MHEIAKKAPLLDANGKLTEAGYAKTLILDYDRKAIKAASHRIKEWDYYLISDGIHAVALTIDDNSYMGLDSVSFLDLSAPCETTKSIMQWLTFGKKALPSTSADGDVSSHGKHHSLTFKNNCGARLLEFEMDNFRDGKKISGRFELLPTDTETMVIATPFDKDEKAFYYNQKINCIPASGYVTLGDETTEFAAGNTYAVLDWGRGVWTYNNTWYWSSASGAVDGVPFGFNLGYGFGNTSAASENMLFYGGKAHKLSQVTFAIPQKDGGDDFMSPWIFSSDDGRFEAVFTPVIDRAAKTDIGVICSDQHQVFGNFNGYAVLDDGTKIEMNDFPGFAEKVRNKW